MWPSKGGQQDEPSNRRRYVLTLLPFLSLIMFTTGMWGVRQQPSAVHRENISHDMIWTPKPTLNVSSDWHSLTSHEVIRFQESNGVIIVMVASSGYGGMIASMVCRFLSLGLLNFVMVAVDEESYAMCKKYNYPAFRATELVDSEVLQENQSGAATFNSLEFKSIAKIKEKAVMRALSMGLNVLLTDVDIAWLRNPLPFLMSKELQGYDFVVQSDAYAWLAPLHEINSGFYFVRSTPEAIATLQSVIDIGSSNPGMREQTAFHRALCRRSGILTHLFWEQKCTSPQNAKVTLLPRKIFPNGHNFLFDYGPDKSFLFNPYIIHFNWIVGEGVKEVEMKYHGLWSVRDDGVCLTDYAVNTNKEVTPDNGGLLLFLSLSLIIVLVLVSTFRKIPKPDRVYKSA